MDGCGLHRLAPPRLPGAPARADLRVASMGVAVAAGPLAGTAAAKKLTAANWDSAEQRLVVHEAVMSEEGAASRAPAP